MVRLERDALLTIGIGFLCVLALATAAGTLDTVLVPEGQGIPGVSNPGGNGSMPGGDSNISGGQGGEIVTGDSGVESGRITMCVRPLTGLAGVLLYFAPVAIAFYLLARRYNASTSMLVGYATSPFIVLGYFFLTACPEAGGNMPGESEGGSPLEGVAGTEVLDATNVSPFIPIGLFGLALLGVVLLFYTSTDDEELASETDDEIDETSVAELGQAAGAAADRLQERNADVDNEVYRAWREMTGLLDVEDPETSTPGTFAEAAVAAGIDREHVTELTRLFEEVRYGHKDPEAREDHAVEIFRTIESAYAPDRAAETGSGEPAFERDESHEAPDDRPMTDEDDSDTEGTE